MMNSENSSFSTITPGFQWAIDSTSLGEAKLCPKKYHYSIVQGLQPKAESPHLRFGLLLHEGRERYERLHQQQPLLSHDELLDAILDWALRETWDQRLGRPWLSGHNVKNRQTLIQTLVWYLDAMAQGDNLETLILANGKPAVELSFRFDSGLVIGGENIILCGHLDRLAELSGQRFVSDIKTSSSELSPRWLAQFTPGNQFSLYSIAARVAFDEPVKGLIVDGVQVGVGFARFARHIVPRDEATLEEWLEDAGYWIGQMHQWAREARWPRNDKACDLYGGCPFRSVCSKSPASRERELALNFIPRVWDPLKTREV